MLPNIKNLFPNSRQIYLMWWEILASLFEPQCSTHMFFYVGGKIEPLPHINFKNYFVVPIKYSLVSAHVLYERISCCDY